MRLLFTCAILLCLGVCAASTTLVSPSTDSFAALTERARGHHVTVTMTDGSTARGQGMEIGPDSIRFASLEGYRNPRIATCEVKRLEIGRGHNEVTMLGFGAFFAGIYVASTAFTADDAGGYGRLGGGMILSGAGLVVALGGGIVGKRPLRYDLPRCSPR